MTNLARLSTFLCFAALAACSGDDGPPPTDPTQVAFGDTALVVVVNPVINDANDPNVPMPGTVLSSVQLDSDDGIRGVTNADGIAVLAPLTAGLRTITVSGGGITGSFTVMMTDGELRELAVAADGARVEKMVELDYKTDQVVEITPAMTNQQVNDAIGVSDRVVFLMGGVYAGDLDFAGSRVTLFGEGALGGEVTIQGNVTISGSDSRIRGALITGNLTNPSSGSGLTFSRVNGMTSSTGSDGTLLANDLCGGASITGSGSTVLGNSGAAPLPASCN